MKAVIMAGGFGTRLRPITCNLPKPMVPVVNRPMMEHIVELLKEHNITEAISILFYQADIIMNHFQDGSRFGIKMHYVGADDDYGTAGSVKNAQRYLNERFIVISGDVLTDFDLTDAIRFHEKKGAKVTIILTRVSNPLAYGVVITNEEGKIVKFLEKPSWGEVFSDTVNTGIYIIEPEILNLIPEKKNFDFSQNLFPLILEKGLPLYGYIADGYWKDIGNLDEYRYAHYDILQGNVRVKIPGKRLDLMGRDVFIGENVDLGKKIDFRGGVIIGNNVKIGNGVKLHNVIIGDNCVIEDGANLYGCIIWEGTHIGRNALLRENIIGKNCQIGDKVYIAERTVVADEVEIGSEAVIKPNLKIWPYKKVEAGAFLSHSLIWGEKWTRFLFGREGVNGLANIEITPEFAAKLGATYGATLGKGAVVCTSRDADKTSRLINRAVISGLLSAGVNVYDLRVMPLPVSRYFIRSQGLGGGIHTSFNQIMSRKELLLRFLDSNGLDLPRNKQKSIERLFFREDFARAQPEEVGELSFPHRVVDYYREGLLGTVNFEMINQYKPKVVIDYSYGAASAIFPSILGKIGCDIISLNSYISETGMPQPDLKEATERLGNIVKTTFSLLGVLISPEAEKIIITTQDGKVLDNIETFILFTYLMSRHNKNREDMFVAAPLYAPKVLEDVAAHFGVKLVRTKTNQTEMMNIALDEKALLVGDLSGRFIIPAFQPAFDAMAATLKLIELLIKEEERIEDILEELPKPNFAHVEVACNWDKKGTVMRKLIEYSKNKEAELIEGVKIFEDKDNWALLIPDNEKPVFHLWVEADSEENVKSLVDKYTQLVKSWEQED